MVVWLVDETIVPLACELFDGKVQVQSLAMSELIAGFVSGHFRFTINQRDLNVGTCQP
jgi:hypothetical protein